LTEAIKDSIMVGMDFEQTLVTAGSKFGGIKKGTESFLELEEVAMRLGRTTEFTSSQAAMGLQYMSMAGFSAKNSMLGLPTIVDFATASGLDLATATDIATDSLGAFALTSKDAAEQQKNLEKMMSVMAMGANKHNFDVEQFFETIKQSAPLLKGARVEIETYTAAVGMMADAGIKGEKSGTYMKNILNDLQAPTSGARKAIEKLGVKMVDATGNMRYLPDIFEDLNKVLPQTAERQQKIAAIFGQIPIAGVNVLLNTGSDAWREYDQRLRNTDGVLKDLATTMRDTTLGDLNTFKSAAEGAGLALFKILQPSLEGALGLFTKFANGLNAFLTDAPFVVIVLGYIAMGITAVSVAMAVIPPLIAAIQFGLFALQYFFVTNPLGVWIIAIGAVIGLIIAMVVHWDKVKSAFNSFYQKIKPALELILILLGPIGDGIKEWSIEIGGINGLGTEMGYWLKAIPIFIGEIYDEWFSVGGVIDTLILDPLMMVTEILSRLPGQVGNTFEEMNRELKQWRKTYMEGSNMVLGYEGAFPKGPLATANATSVTGGWSQTQSGYSNAPFSPAIAQNNNTKEERNTTTKQETTLKIQGNGQGYSTSNGAPKTTVTQQRTAK
jgi:TP901 family phage tail tape measure protein